MVKCRPAVGAAADAQQPPQADERQDQRNIAVSAAEVRPHRGIREVLGMGVAEDADDDDADEFDRAGCDGDPVRDAVADDQADRGEDVDHRGQRGQ